MAITRRSLLGTGAALGAAALTGMGSLEALAKPPVRDPKTGKTLRSYQLEGSIAPAASPVAFRDGRLLAPLSDGTLLLLAEERLKGK